MASVTRLPLIASDTEPFVRQTSQLDYRSGKLQQGRDAVLQDLASLLRVPFDDLLQKLHPHDPNGQDINNILIGLQDQGIVQGSQWKMFMQTPSLLRVHEETVFEPLQEIINGILRLASNVTLSYVKGPHHPPLSEREDTSKPDGFLKLVKTKTVKTSQPVNQTHWFDIVVPFEFKKKKGDHDDNERQMIWNLHCIMREDPCRRFAYGVTIENEDLRVWFTNRAYLAATTPINFRKDLQRVISLFYSLGSVSDVGLGWDPTIERVLIGEMNQYKIVVDGMQFTTLEELSMYGADSMIGRGTRVWKAMDEQENVVVVKDSWGIHDRLPEGEILEQVLVAIRKKFPDRFDEAKKYFVNIKKFRNVVLDDDQDDETLNLNNESTPDHIPAGYEWVKLPVEKDLSFHLAKVHTPSIGDTPDPNPPLTRTPHVKRDDAPIPRRVHHRTIIDDLGVAVQDLKNLQDIIHCLSDVRKALYYMHLVGWVHRDISIGNALWVLDGIGIGKLMDFEYAKSVDCNVSHDVRTGTINFMACEVREMTYAFGPNVNPMATREAQPIAASVPFRMNFLHDLESVFWSLAWVLYRHTDRVNQIPNLADRLEMFQKLFPGSAFHRLMFLRYQVHAAQEIFANDFPKPSWSLAVIAYWLVKGFTAVEKTYPRISAKDDSIIKATHEGIEAAFSEALQSTHDIQLISVSEILEKRNLSEDEQSSPATKKKKKLR